MNERANIYPSEESIRETLFEWFQNAIKNEIHGAFITKINGKPLEVRLKWGDERDKDYPQEITLNAVMSKKKGKNEANTRTLW